MKKYRVVIGVACVIAALTALGIFLLHGVQIDVLNPAGAIAKQQKSLLIFATLIMAVVAIPIFVMLGLFAWKYRAGNTKRKKGDYKPEWSENNKLEILWWGIPIIMISALAVTAWVTSHSLDPYKKIESHKQTLTVQVVALQWKWLFIYPELGVATVNKLPITEQSPVHFTLSADAPMSAFWVPALGSQIYSMNGMSSQLNLIADTTGEFRGYSTNINGAGYADMKFTVQSMTDVNFSNWLENAQKSPNLLDEAQYTRLTEPGTMEATTYVLADKDLYAKIVGKYMSGMDHSNGDGTHTMIDGTVMDDGEMNMHDMHNMEGM